MKHEFGHIFGAPDYYSYSDTHEAAIATFDMMRIYCLPTTA